MNPSMSGDERWVFIFAISLLVTSRYTPQTQSKTGYLNLCPQSEGDRLSADFRNSCDLISRHDTPITLLYLRHYQLF